MQRTTTSSVELFFCLVAILWLHRVMATPFLMDQLDTQKISLAVVLAVGILSDLWVAFLVAGSYLLVSSLWRIAAVLTGSQRREVDSRVVDPLALLLFIAISLSVIMHQPYVEFFHFQIIPFHLNYLGDRLFIAANGASLMSIRACVIALVMAILAIFWWKRRPLATLKGFHGVLLAFVAMPCLAVAAHSANLHWRVQRFVPAELQMNYFEHLYYQLQFPVNPPQPETAELAALGSRIGIDLSASTLHRLLIPVNAAQKPSPVAHTLAGFLQEAMRQDRRPLVLVVLAESLRPAETGYHHRGEALQTSLTPHIDEFAGDGVAFLKAFSTSNVTRGGQEAVWCGHLAAVGTAMMRERPDITLGCLPELLATTDGDKPARKPQSFFLHGGRGEFDSQEIFWRHRGVTDILTQSGFDAAKTPATSWGVSDIALMDRAIATIPKLVAQTGSQSFALGLILTVTNHIPWQLPADTPPAIASLAAVHPSHLTTAYTDEAFGRLVRGLKVQGVWENTLLILSSDHGTAIMPHFYQIDDESAHRTAHDMTHIVLAMGGGLVDKALKKQGITGGIRVNDVVSQAAVAPFLAYVTGHETLTFATPMLLAEGPRMPVMANLGSSLYFPAEDILFAKEDIMTTPLQALTEREKIPMTYARAYLNMLNQLHGMPMASGVSESSGRSGG